MLLDRERPPQGRGKIRSSKSPRTSKWVGYALGSKLTIYPVRIPTRSKQSLSFPHENKRNPISTRERPNTERLSIPITGRPEIEEKRRSRAEVRVVSGYFYGLGFILYFYSSRDEMKEAREVST